MTFTAPEMLVGLAAAIGLSWLLPARFQVHGAALCGVIFLGFASPPSLAILVTSAGVTYRLCNTRSRISTTGLVLLCAGLGGLFALFKTRVSLAPDQFVIPLGLSYYIFRQLHYAFESYAGSLRRHGPAEFFCYLFLLPALLVGPIHRFPEYLRDLRRRRWDWDRFSYGLERAFHGYAKLIIVANFLIAGQLKNFLTGLAPRLSPLESQFLDSLYMWLDLYLRFSACSDIAIGVSAMMGFTIIENFNFPFLAGNISDFWRRWHISLTSWCRDYVYKPAAAVTRSPLAAVAVAMLVIGLWHEFSMRYILWGLYHALGIMIQQRWSRFRDRFPKTGNRLLRKTEEVAGIALTMIFVISSYMLTGLAHQAISSWFMGS
ncbi:MAG: hypothetical protein L3J03_06535 [Desulfobacterales bacterium]|nr:hypothetical protein [Desulfobacterales bacterium]